MMPKLVASLALLLLMVGVTVWAIARTTGPELAVVVAALAFSTGDLAAKTRRLTKKALRGAEQSSEEPR